MSSFGSTRKQNTLRKETGSLSQQVTELREELNNLVKAINKSIGPIPPKMKVIEEVLDAVMNLSGFTSEQVQEQVAAKREEMAKADYDNSQTAMAEGVANGYLTEIATIAPKTVIQCRESDPAGKLVSKDDKGNHIYQGRVEVMFDGLPEETQALLLGKAIGDTVELPSGGKLEIDKVYALDEEKMRAHLTQTMTKATTDAAALETPLPPQEQVSVEATVP